MSHGIGDEHPHAHGIMIFCGLFFASIWIIDSLFLHFGVEVSNNIHVLIRVVLFLFALALSFKLGMSSHNVIFDHQEESSNLITEGVFSVVRHPMYLSILLLKLGFLLLTMSFISIIPWVLCIILYDKIAVFEERELTRVLGEEYLEYMKKVPRWIPKFPKF